MTTPVLVHSGGVPIAGRPHRDPTAGTDRRPAVVVTGSRLTDAHVRGVAR